MCHCNKLPLEIKQCPSKDTFKYQVKCLLYNRLLAQETSLNCIDRMFFACMLSDDGKLIICIGPHRCALMCYPSSNITYCIACLLCIGVILLNKFNSIQFNNKAFLALRINYYEKSV